jgi:hypothetical protein|tara:strand:- start:200 stop:715 length:516 start_codon:yes stop_codon:yes gene_type:complete
MNLQDLYNTAQEAGVDVDAAPSGKIELTDGAQYLVQAEKVTTGFSNAGTLSYSAMFRVMDGPDNVNRVFWENWYISTKEGAAGFNAKHFHTLGLLGITLEVLLSVEGEDVDRATAVLTASGTTPVSVTAGYRPDRNDPAKIWTDNFFEAAQAGGAVVQVAPAAGGDVDLDF